MKEDEMNTQENGNKLHVDGVFEMEFVVAGEDEHGLPLLEVNLYPVSLEGMIGDDWALKVDQNHLVAGVTVPLEETGLATGDIDSLPLNEGWALITTSHGAGLHVEDVEQTFGSRAAVFVLKALADALLSESINADQYGNPYRAIELDGSNRYEEVLDMQKALQARIEADEQRRATHCDFNARIDREFRF